MPLILDVLTHIDERSAAAGARQLEQQFERGGEVAGVSFGTNLVKGVTSGFAAGDFDSMLGVLSSGGMAAKAATHGTAIGVAFAGGITVAAAAGLVDLGVKVGETFEGINRDITLHTAASGKALDDLKAHADALVGSLDSSAAHIGGDMATMATRLQMTAGPALDELTKNVEMLRDRMGDFNAGALAGALQNMGVTGAQANDALASIAATVQRTATPLSELATTLAANTELFKDMHLTVGQAGNVIGELSAKGIPATTALMGLQMAMKKTPEGEDFATYIKSVADALDYFGSQGPKGEAAAEQISVALGGPRKWTDLSAAAHAYLDTANQGAAAFAGHGDDLTRLGEQTKTLGNYWDEVKNKISAALAPPGLSVTDEISQKMESLIGFIDAHATDLRNLFEGAISVIEQVVEGLAQVSSFLSEHPGLIEAVAVAFGVWESIKGVNFVLTGLEALTAWFAAAPAEAAAAGAAIDATATSTAATVSAAAGEAGAAVAAAAETANVGMLGLAATMGTIVAQLILWAPTVAGLLAEGGSGRGATMSSTPGAPGVDVTDKHKAGEAYADAHGGKVPDHYQQWLEGKAPMPLELGPYMAAGAPAGTPGAPAPQAPGTGRFAPGQGPDVGGRAAPGLPAAPVAPGGGGTGDAAGAQALLDSLDPAKKGPKGPRLPVAPEVPYPAGYGAPPGPGESAEQYSKQQEILEKRHAIDEAQARLNQIEHANNATAEDIQKAKNDLLHAQREEYSAELEQTKKHAGDMEQLGAKIDNDFGISKGLPGIAENLTKFLANLAFAPAFGAMAGTQAGLGFPGGQGLGGAKGLLGMAGLSGMLGPQFTVGGGGGPSAGGHGSGGGSGLGGVLSNLTGGAAGGTGSGGGGTHAASSGWWGAGAQNPDAGAAGFSNIAMPAGDKMTYTTAALAALGLSPLDQNPAGGGSPQIPQWVQDFVHEHGGPGLTAGSTPHGSLHGNPGGPGYAVDVTGAAGQQDALAKYLEAHPELSAMAIHQSQVTGEDFGIAGGQNVPKGSYFTTPGGTYADEGPMVHWAPSIRPGAGPQPAGASGIPGYAAGGDIAAQAPAMGGPTMGSFGAGEVPIVAHEGEHVLTNSDVQAMGGQQGVYQFRAGLQSGSGPQPSTAGGSGATQIGGLGAPKGLGSGFTVTGGGLIGVAESVPATAASMGMAAAMALHGGAVEDLPHYQDGGEVAAGAGGGAAGAGPAGAGAGPAGAAAAGAGAAGPAASGLGAAGAGSSGGSGTGAGGGGAPGGSVIGAAIGIGIQEMNEAISKSSQMAGALVGGLQQTFGMQQFAQTPLAQSGWLNRIVGGIAGAQPQLPNMGGQSAGKASPEGVPGMTPMMTPPQEISPFGPGRGASPGPAPVATAPAPPPQQPLGPSPSMLGDPSAGRGAGADSLYGPTPDSVAGIGPGGSGGGGAAMVQQSGTIGPAVHIEHYHDEGNSNSAGQDIGRHVEGSYSGQTQSSVGGR